MSTVRSARGRMIDFEKLRKNTLNRASQEADAGETSGLARPEDTFVPSESKPVSKRVAEKTVEKVAEKPRKARTEKSVADDILKDLN